MSKSDYNYAIEENENLIIVEDLNRGRMSVTNNIEEVVCEIQDKHPDCYFEYVIYFDSEGVWDAWDIKNERFILLNAGDLITAKHRLNKIK